MKFLLTPLSLLAALLLVAGCSRSTPPEALPPERAPSELTEAFTKAKPPLKELASQASTALQAGRYAEASVLLLELAQSPELSARERDVVTRSTLTVNQQLREAQTQGEAQAAEHLRRLQQSK